MFQTIRRLGVEPRGTAIGLDHLDVGHRCAITTFDFSVLDRGENQRQVAFLATRKLVIAVDKDDPILLGEPERVLDRRIAGADDHDGFVFILFRVVELILNDGQILTGSAELAQIALEPDRQHDGFGIDGPASREG